VVAADNNDSALLLDTITVVYSALVPEEAALEVFTVMAGTTYDSDADGLSALVETEMFEVIVTPEVSINLTVSDRYHEISVFT